MSVRVQCVRCKRYRVDGIWSHLEVEPVADWLGWCHDCRLLDSSLAEAQRRGESRRLLRARFRGYHADPDATPWDEMRRGK